MFPHFSPAGSHSLLVEFGDVICNETHEHVVSLDKALSTASIFGFFEAVPAYTSLLVRFDPLLTDHDIIENDVRKLIQSSSPSIRPREKRVVEVCYDAEFAPDLSAVAMKTGFSRDEVIAAHSSAEYGVFMYGFAPGYAYLAGVPEQIRLPRKQSAVRDIPAGSVLIAGPQCLVTTMTMPTGWWIIGRSPTRILDKDGDRPFLFDVGDDVVFRRISRADFEKKSNH
ncbi:5-oxoprolinase subunit B family protein [Ochrobactrum chromiisoli]|uniref:Allophanate hydrolase subunit 1 n=1 Tax=Ochrobactrum chromiisoli TaxID=2993941 RepID=A0ABT3QSF7_9HYPH|nr:allophanate hydrolase subunit 1 [Ochrobactrum chromiisoli]MCX2698542.1 allophanate hydrolase subunit 1 [Ochrobactrum chromiisoli]